MSSKDKILITGSTGYVGLRLAQSLVKEGKSVVLPVRARDADHLAERRANLVAQIGPGDVQVVPCDLSLRADVLTLPTDCTAIIHSAATTRFNVESDVADRENREASISLFQLGRKSPKLEKFAYISTVYAAGENSGVIPEEILDRPKGFVNHYERSKWESEDCLSREFSDLPWVIARVATVLADDASGACNQMNAVHNTLKLLYYGLISTVPGNAEVPVYLVCGDFVEKGILAAVGADAKHKVYHVCHEARESLKLSQFLDVAFTAFENDSSFKKRGIHKPLLVDLESFTLLADGISGFGGPVLKEAIGSMVPFARQLFINKQFKNDRLRSVMPDYKAADFAAIIPTLVTQMTAKKWKL